MKTIREIQILYDFLREKIKYIETIYDNMEICNDIDINLINNRCTITNNTYI